MDRDGLKQALREILEEETMYGYPELGSRWQDGTLVLKPADSVNQPKEIPLENFFHKIVMVRDRLRVLEAKLNSSKNLSEADKVESRGEDVDEMFDQAVAIVAETRNASISYVQRRLKIGYNRAARIVEQMELDGMIGPQIGSKGREVFMPSPLGDDE